MVNLQVNRLQDGCSGDEMRAAWATSSESSNSNSEKQRDELAAIAHGKSGRPAQELNHVNSVQELLVPDLPFPIHGTSPGAPSPSFSLHAAPHMHALSNT